MLAEIQEFREKDPASNILFINELSFRPSEPILQILVYKAALEWKIFNRIINFFLYLIK